MIVEYVRKKIVVHVSSELGQHKIVEPDSTSYAVASRRCLSIAMVKPHHVGEAYNSMEITTAL